LIGRPISGRRRSVEPCSSIPVVSEPVQAVPSLEVQMWDRESHVVGWARHPRSPRSMNAGPFHVMIQNVASDRATNRVCRDGRPWRSSQIRVSGSGY
jgi:hypothetical protein